MIFTKNGTVAIPKSKAEFQTDLTLILKSGVDHGLITKEDVDEAWELATIPDEELRKKVEEKLDFMISSLAEPIGKAEEGSDRT